MNKEKDIRVRNSHNWRGLLYALAVGVPGSLAILFVSSYVDNPPALTGVLALVPIFILLLGLKFSSQYVTEVVISSERIQFIYRNGEEENISWDDVISLDPAPLNQRFYIMTYLKENGKRSINTLSQQVVDALRCMSKEPLP